MDGKASIIGAGGYVVLFQRENSLFIAHRTRGNATLNPIANLPVDYYVLGERQIIDQHNYTFENTLVVVIEIKETEDGKVGFKIIYRKCFGAVPTSATCFVCMEGLTEYKTYFVPSRDYKVYELRVNNPRIRELTPGDIIQEPPEAFSLVSDATGELGILTMRENGVLEAITIGGWDGIKPIYLFGAYCIISGRRYTVLVIVDKYYDGTYYYQCFVYAGDFVLKFITEFFSENNHGPKDVVIAGNTLIVYLQGNIFILMLDPNYKKGKLGKREFAPYTDCVIENKSVFHLGAPDENGLNRVYFAREGIYAVNEGRINLFNYSRFFDVRSIKMMNLPNETKKKIKSIMFFGKGVLPPEILREIIDYLIMATLLG